MPGVNPLKLNLAWIMATTLALLAEVTSADGGDNVLEDDSEPTIKMHRGRENTGWMVTALIFIILFVIVLAVCIYLCVERRRRLQQFYQQTQIQRHQPQQYGAKNHRGQRAIEGGADGYF